MIHGVGVDILDYKTIEPSVRDINDSFVRKIYTQAERELILSRPVPLNSFATRFAGKEAVYKAFGTNGDAFRLNEVEILENADGVPQVHLHGKAADLAKILGIQRISISLSYDGHFAIAYAVAECCVPDENHDS